MTKETKVPVVDQQAAASLAATNPSSLKKANLVCIYLDQMLISGRTPPKAPASLPLKVLLHLWDLWCHCKGWKGGKDWEDSLFLLVLSQFFIWNAATSLIQRQIVWTPCVFLAPEPRVSSDENKFQSTMEKGSAVTLLLAKLEPDTLNNFNSLVLWFLGKTFHLWCRQRADKIAFSSSQFPLVWWEWQWYHHSALKSDIAAFSRTLPKTMKPKGYWLKGCRWSSTAKFLFKANLLT